MRLIRFVLTILIIALAFYCVYYLLELNKEYKANHIQVEETTVNEENKTSGDKKVEEKEVENVQIIIPNDDEVLSEEDIQRIVAESDKIYESNISANVTKSFNEEVGQEIYGGSESKSGDTRVQALIQHAGSMVSIMPFNDDSEDGINEQYHYGDHNNLVMFVAKKGEKELNRYYFSNDKLIKSLSESGDTDVVSDEDADVILNRAQNIYNRYIK